MSSTFSDADQQARAAAIDNRGPAVLVVTIAMTVLATVFTLLRVVSRIGIVRRFAADDYWMIVAWVIACGMSGAICYGTSVGLGRHMDDVPDVWNAPLKKSEYVFSVLYNPALMATKTSILLFYLTLPETKKYFKWLTFATLFVVNAAGIALTILNILQCRPVGAAFETPVPISARCQDIVTLYLSSAPVNIITDLIILFLPMPILTAMQLPKKQKIILIITFSFGFFAAVVDVVRIAYLQEAASNRLEDVSSNVDNPGSRSRNSTDVSWYASLSFMWSAVEVNVGIMCANVPGLKPLVTRFMPQFIRDAANNATHRGTKTASYATSPPPNFPSRLNSPTLDTAEIGPPGLRPIEARSPPMSPTRSSPTSTGHSAAKKEALDTDADDGDGDLDIMQFLTTPDMSELPDKLKREQTARTFRTEATLHTDNTGRNSNTFYDFVQMERRKSLENMTVKESIFPISVVTVLFFLWGCGYGFLDALNGRFQAVANWNTSQVISIHSVYFGAYILSSLTFGRLILKHFGFKACFMVGLVIYACGTLVFWPSAVLSSFPAFLISNMIVGAGLATLEVSANPFVALCGPQEYMEFRLQLSQGIQGIGSIVSPLLATKVLFKSSDDATALVDVQWTYLGIALFVFLLAVGFYYIPIPEASRTELAQLAPKQTRLDPSTRFKGIRVIWITLGMGVASMFFYVGAQESVSTSFGPYIRATYSATASADNNLAIAHTTFAAARFITCLFNYWGVPARILLAGYFILAAVFSVLCTQLKGGGALTSILLLYACEGPIFSLIYAMALRGMGRHTKDASALLTAAITGGSILPPIQHAVVGSYDMDIRELDNITNPRYMKSFWVVFAAFIAGGLALPLWTNANPLGRLQVKPIKYGEEPETLPRSASAAVAGGTEENEGDRGSSSSSSMVARGEEKIPAPLNSTQRKSSTGISRRGGEVLKSLRSKVLKSDGSRPAASGPAQAAKKKPQMTAVHDSGDTGALRPGESDINAIDWVTKPEGY